MAEYIDKQSVYKEACAGCTCHGDEIGSCFSSEPCERLCFAFASANTVDIAPVVHGRWERRRNSLYCTNCGKGYKITYGVLAASAYNYCPNCGAKMNGGTVNAID